MRNAAASIVSIGLALSACALGLFLFPFDSDGAFAVRDGIWMGMGAEAPDPATSISPHHPLFHVVAIGLVRLLRAVHVDHPGHVAIRIIAAAGGAWLLVQIGALAGRRRVLVGAAFALVVLCARGFVVEAAAGENVLPATAAALFALTLATRPGTRVAAIAAATTVALLLRQDNIFVVPGVAAALAATSPPKARVAPVAWFLAFAGLATIAGYVAAWAAATGCATRFTEWLMLHGDTSWTGPEHFELGRVPTYLHSVGVAMTGQLRAGGGGQPLVASVYVVAIVAGGLMLRGSSARRALVAPIVVTLIGRAVFHTWYEADNFEWAVLPIAFVAAGASGLADGAPATKPTWRAGGVVILLGLAAWCLAAHAPSTLRLGDRRFMTAVRETIALEREPRLYIAYGDRAATALALSGVPHEIVPEHLGIDQALVRVAMARKRLPTTVICDRIVGDGMPWRRTQAASRTVLDALADTSEIEVLRFDGITFAVRFSKIEPRPPESRPGVEEVTPR